MWLLEATRHKAENLSCSRSLSFSVDLPEISRPVVLYFYKHPRGEGEGSPLVRSKRKQVNFESTFVIKSSSLKKLLKNSRGSSPASMV